MTWHDKICIVNLNLSPSLKYNSCFLFFNIKYKVIVILVFLLFPCFVPISLQKNHLMDSKMIMMKIISMFPAYRYPPKDPPSVGWMRSQGGGLEGVRESHRGVSIHTFGFFPIFICLASINICLWSDYQKMREKHFNPPLRET